MDSTSVSRKKKGEGAGRSKSLRKELLVIYFIMVLELAFATVRSPIVVAFNGSFLIGGFSLACP